MTDQANKKEDPSSRADAGGGLTEASEILAWLNQEQKQATRWGFNETGVYRFQMTGPELMRIRRELERRAPAQLPQSFFPACGCTLSAENGERVYICPAHLKTAVADAGGGRAELARQEALDDLIKHGRAMVAAFDDNDKDDIGIGTFLEIRDAFKSALAALSSPPVGDQGVREAPACEACRGTGVVPVWDSQRRDDWHQQTCPACQPHAAPVQALAPADKEQE